MLKQGKTWHRTNQKGSIILTVVIMIMVLFTLTTICLDVIHHSTKVSSKNVQKTQAKLTAEKVLTEFIEGYKAGQIGDGEEAASAYAGLQAMATSYTQDKPHIIKVSMQNNAGTPQADFDQTFGETELHIYGTTSGFVVESICTYSTQTQTASVVFEGSLETPYVPSNTIESQEGKLIGNNQLSNGVDGSVYIEKGTGDDSKFKKLSRAGNKAHIYSEFSVRVDDNWTIEDMENHTTQNEFQDYADSNGGWFQQAPTLVVDGYFTNNNDSNQISTKVGKTDANGVSPTVTQAGYKGAATYDKNNLGNYDGFVRVDKKIILPKAESMIFGDKDLKSTTDIIDVYTHGLMLGRIPSGIVKDGSGNVVHDFAAEATAIRSVYPVNGSDNGLWTPQTNGQTKINGNLYVYKGAEDATQDGSVCIDEDNRLVVNGDVFIEGNVYFFNSNDASTQHYIQCNNLHIKGDIYIGSVSNNADGNLATLGSTWSIYYVNDSGQIVKKSDGSVASLGNYFKYTKIDNKIDTTIQRNQFPAPGYDPQTGKSNPTRRKLGDIYKEASANDIFTMDVDESDPDLTMAAQDISSKYADAMSADRRFDMNSDNKRDIKSPAPKYKDKSGAEHPVIEMLACSAADNGDKYYQINASCMLKEYMVQPDEGLFQNCQRVGYVINLTDQDIVVCLPIGSVGCQFRVNRANISAAYKDDKGNDKNAGPYVYFMYYDPTRMAGMNDPKTNKKYTNDGCLYYAPGIGVSNTIKKTDGTSVGITPIGAGGHTTGSSKGYIMMGGRHNPQNGTMVGDLTAVYTKDSGGNLDGSIPNNFKYDGFQNMGGVSDIMYLVPDEVGFGFINGSKVNFDTWTGNGSKAWYAQGLVYGLNSMVKLGCFESANGTNSGIYGQIKGYSVNFYGDRKANHTDCPMGDGSLLGYVGAKNGAVSVVKLQYFIY